MKFYRSLFLISIMSMLVFTSCEKNNNNDDDNNPPAEQKGSFKIEIEHLFDQAAFELGKSYVNSSGEDLNFSKVKYYLTNIKLEKMDGTVWSEEESYRIVDLSNPSSLEITLNDVPAGEYHHVMFTVGVDSARNVSGAQEGALSPANGMFWSWNSGYIFFKLEGTCPQSPDGNFVYHIGGFSGATNAIAEHDFHMHMPNLSVSPGATPIVHLMVDIKKAFDGMHNISVSNNPKVHMPGMMAVHISHNFKTAFKLDHVHP